MKICPTCQTQLADEIVFCPRCGAQQPGAPQAATYQVPPTYQPGQVYQPYVDPADHTAELTPEDIGEYKLFAMLPYLFPVLGLLVALLGAKDSPYVQFHVRQALKILICTTLVAVFTALTFWTVLAALAGGVCLVILEVLNIVAFFQVCGNKAKEPAIIKGLKFLK